jgi:transcriptional regulator with XRE-family HTH domain
MELNEIIKSRRKVLDISQLDLAEMSDLSLATVKDIERGKGNPSLSTVLKIVNVLGLEMNFNVRQTV